MTPPERKPGESELDYLRRKEEMFGVWQGEALERIVELERRAETAESCAMKYRRALGQISEALSIVGKHAVIESHEISADDFARDFAPFINVMAHHGVAPYAKTGRKKA